MSFSLPFSDPNIPPNTGDAHFDNIRGRYDRVSWPLYEPIHQKYISICK